MNILRIALTATVLVTVTFVPWYIVLTLVVMLALYFKQYYESLFIVALSGALHGRYFMPIAACAIMLVVLEYIKIQTILYKA